TRVVIAPNLGWKNVPLPPKSKKIIPGVVLEEGAVPDQIRKTTSIAPDSTVEDLFLFEVPDSKQANLIFSIPPSFHRGTAPILFRLQYEYRQPPGPKVHEIGDEIAFDGVVFRVNAAKLSYAELTHPEKGKGFSDKPVFAVSYTITNESDSSVQYEPGHTAVSGIRAAQLKGPDEFFARKRFPSGMKVVGQTSGSMEIKPSSSTSDVAIFEKPGKGIDTLTFRYPATRFGRSGLVRVRIPYEHEVPKPPKPLRSASGEDK
ncbi:MAG: hypothetical protein ABEL76_09165, partial [Bradymonadaceae bacterium]